MTRTNSSPTKSRNSSGTTKKIDDSFRMIDDPFVFVDNPLAAEAKKKAEKAALRKLDSLEAAWESSNANTLELELTDNPSEIPSPPAANKETTTFPTLLKTRMKSWLSLSKKNRSLSVPPPHQSSISSSQLEEYKEIKLAFFWIGSFFLLQSLVFAVSVMKIFFPEPETYWFMVLLERLLFHFMVLNTLVIVASDPFSDYKIIEIISVVMLLLSRSSSLLSNEANYATEREIDTNPGFPAGMIEVCAYLYFFFMALRYKKLLLKETVGTVRTLVYNTLPKIITSAILSMAYMNSDSIQCVLSNENVLVTPTAGVVLCTDLDISTKAMNTLILVGTAMTLFVSPTDKNDYSMKSFFMFSFSFCHQILVACVGVSLFVALYLYSTMKSGNELISNTSGYEFIDVVF